MPREAALKNLTPPEANPKPGLSSEEASSRLFHDGPNEIQAAKAHSPWILLFHQFKSPLVAILLAACVLSAALGEGAEALAILAILGLNALIGFLQEHRAENAILALKNMTAPRARVLRNGKQLVIPARDLVRGDALILEAGDIVAADAKISEAARLQVNEAVLTGESIPVEKIAGGEETGALAEQSGMVFMGTSVATGTALVVVTATGKKTELGKIARLVESAENSATPLQLQLANLGRVILGICLAAALVVGILGWAGGREWQEILIFSISLAVAAVPEGMPAIVTVALALGVQRMAARNALIRKLPSVETLGSVSVICTDKTGTLTTGNMRVREIWGEDHRETLRVAAACSDAELEEERDSGTGDPTEIAILLAARERDIHKGRIEIEIPRLATNPFDSDRKRMSIYRSGGTLYAKGAVESILEVSAETPARIEAVKRANLEMTERGLRVLAIATGSEREERNLRISGLVGLADPPRTEVMDAIREARSAGITPIMITGDHPITAGAIAKELGLVMEGESMDGRVHARATPENKLQLVRSWKRKGAIVAMTGDGVNDAPALQEAHIGIAMGKVGTEVTRQSADLILADDNFANIVAAVREGRAIYQNIRKAILYLLTGNFAELIVVLGASVAGLPLPLAAAHLLWVNLVTDSLPGLALIADPTPTDIMKRPPRPSMERILRIEDWKQLLWVSTLEACVILSLYGALLETRGPIEARSLAFTTFVFSQIFRSFGARSRTRIFWEVGAWSNLWLLAIVVLTGALQLSLHFLPPTQKIFDLVPITGPDLALIIPISLVAITAVESKKLIGRALKRTRPE